MLKSATMLAPLLAFSLFAFVPQTWAAQAQGPQTGTLEQIIPGHYIYANGPRASGVIATSEGVVVIDGLTDEAMARNQRQLIANQIRQPVRYLISSTFHDNYTGGNLAYQDAVKIGHENYKTDLIDMMKTDNIPAAVQQARLPHVTYRDRMTLTLGGKEIQIIHIGKAHTTGDSIIVVPQDRIAYISELFFYDRFPWMNTGWVNWINAIDIVLAIPNIDIFVPGQGPARWGNDPKRSREALIKARQVLVDARDAVAKEIARGATEDEVVATVLLPQYKDLGGYEQQRPVVLRNTYRDLKGILSYPPGG